LGGRDTTRDGGLFLIDEEDDMRDLPFDCGIFWPCALAACLVAFGCDDGSSADEGAGVDGSTDSDSDSDTGIEDYGIGFECETPDDLLDPLTDTYTIVKAKGRYNDCEDLSTPKEAGIGELLEYVDAVEQAADYGDPDIGRHASDLFAGSDHHLHITYWDKTDVLGEGHSRQHYGVVFIDADALPAILAEDRNYLELWTEYWYEHAYYEQRAYEDDHWLKICTTIDSANEPASRVFMCHVGVEEYAIGETISLVGLIHTEALEESPESCDCIKNDVAQPSCEEYDDLPTEV
jgi:hypothetical protein